LLDMGAELLGPPLAKASLGAGPRRPPVRLSEPCCRKVSIAPDRGRFPFEGSGLKPVGSWPTRAREAMMMNALATAAGHFPDSSDDTTASRPGFALARWFVALSDADAAAKRHLLLLRFAVINLIAMALLGAAWIKGWVDLILAGDSTRQVLLIAGVFAYGLVRCGGKVLITSIELNQISNPHSAGSSRVRKYLEAINPHDAQSRALSASALKMKLMSRIASIRHIANSLVFLGLLGTVIGFIMALSGVDAQAAGDVDA